MFAQIHGDAIARLDKRCAWRCYQRGEPIVDYLDETDDVHFVVSGQARASVYSLSGKMVTFCDVSPGEMFGEYAAIDGGPRSVGVEAISNCVVASLPAPDWSSHSPTEFGSILSPITLLAFVASR